jgi:hypothetical protein
MEERGLVQDQELQAKLFGGSTEQVREQLMGCRTADDPADAESRQETSGVSGDPSHADAVQEIAPQAPARLAVDQKVWDCIANNPRRIERFGHRELLSSDTPLRGKQVLDPPRLDPNGKSLAAEPSNETVSTTGSEEQRSRIHGHPPMTEHEGCVLDRSH